jgi:hypothetical protein
VRTSYNADYSGFDPESAVVHHIRRGRDHRESSLDEACQYRRKLNEVLHFVNDVIVSPISGRRIHSSVTSGQLVPSAALFDFAQFEVGIYTAL